MKTVLKKKCKNIYSSLPDENANTAGVCVCVWGGGYKRNCIRQNVLIVSVSVVCSCSLILRAAAVLTADHQGRSWSTRYRYQRRRVRRASMAASCAWFLVLGSVFLCNLMKTLLPSVSSFVSVTRAFFVGRVCGCYCCQSGVVCTPQLM